MRLINGDATVDAVDKRIRQIGYENDPLILSIRQAVREVKPVDAVTVVRCRDCKHRPTGTNRDDLEFPDDKCPCRCEDFWYSWKPSDDWFCGNGERKDGDTDGV